MHHSGSIHCPLHHRRVGFRQVQELRDGQPLTIAPVAQNIVNVEQLKWRPARLKDKDKEEGDDRQPEVSGAKFTCAAGGTLDQEGPPGDKQEDDGHNEGQHK